MPPLKPYFTKDPAAVLDYTIDWDADDWLGTDTVSTATWTVPAGLTQPTSATNTSTTTTVWLGSGVEGQDYDVACKIVTAGGRTDERTIRIQVRQR